MKLPSVSQLTGTSASILTRIRFAVVNSMLTSLSSEALLTNATEIVYIVDTLASISTRIGVTVVNVNIAHVTYPSRLTDTPERKPN